MKKLFTFITAVFLTAAIWAQSPAQMSYQAVIRDAQNELLTLQGVGVQISILQGSITGTAVYTETHTTSTNSNGLVSLAIGTGATAGDFASIDWANGPYFIKTETDPAGGTTYTISGTQQLLSVPFALHAQIAENGLTPAQETTLTNTSGTNTGDQDISGIVTNTASIRAIEAEQITQNTAIATNTAKVGYTEALVSNHPAVVAYTATIADLTSQLEEIKTRLAQLEGNTDDDQDDSTGYDATKTVQENLNNGVSILDLLAHVTVDELYGNTYEGGFIFYVNETDGTGLVAVPNDQSTSAKWGCKNIEIDGADGVAIGTGAQNTLDILAGCSETGTAAQLCADLVLNEKEDWFLPSKDELNAMYVNLHQNGFGSFTTNWYWTSSESSGENIVNATQFQSGWTAWDFGKTTSIFVRAVRAF